MSPERDQNYHEVKYLTEFSEGISDCIAAVHAYWRLYEKEKLLNDTEFLSDRHRLVHDESEDQAPLHISAFFEMKKLVQSSISRAVTGMRSVRTVDTKDPFFANRIDHLQNLVNSAHDTIHTGNNHGQQLSVRQVIAAGFSTAVTTSIAARTYELLYGRMNFHAKSSLLQIAQTSLLRLNDATYDFGILQQPPGDSSGDQVRSYGLLKPGIPTGRDHYTLHTDKLREYGWKDDHRCLAFRLPSASIQEEAERAGMHIPYTIPILSFYDDMSEIYDEIIVGWGNRIGNDARRTILFPSEIALFEGTDPDLPCQDLILGSIWQTYEE